MTKKEDRRSRRSKAGAAVILAPVYIPALWRVLDHRRPEGEPLNGDGLDLEQIYFDSIDGTRLHMTACGKGKDTLFFVHGWTCNETIFRYQQEHFSDRYRVYTLELRGHGGSEIPESLDYHPERLAEDLEAAIRLVDPESFAVGGHSMGGFTAFKWFERFGSEYEGRLKGLAIIDSTGTDLTEGIIFGSAIKRLYPLPVANVLLGVGHHNKISDALKSAARESSLAYGLVRWGAFGKRPRGQHVEHVREMVLSTPMTTMALAAKSLFDFHYDYYLPNVDVPVVLLVGERDKLTSRQANERTAGLLPDARLKVFPDAGHCTLLERSEEFNAELDAFFDALFGA